MLVTLPSSKVLPLCEAAIERCELTRQRLVAEHVDRYNTAQLRRLLVRVGLAQPKLIDDKQAIGFGQWNAEGWRDLCDQVSTLLSIRELANLGNEVHLTDKEVALIGL